MSRADDLLPIPPRGGHDIDTSDGFLPLLAPPELKSQVTVEERLLPGPDGAPDVRSLVYSTTRDVSPVSPTPGWSAY